MSTFLSPLFSPAEHTARPSAAQARTRTPLPNVFMWPPRNGETRCEPGGVVIGRRAALVKLPRLTPLARKRASSFQLTLPDAAPSGITPARNPCHHGLLCCRERRRRHVPELRPEGASWILARLAGSAGTGVEGLPLPQQPAGLA